MKPTPHSTKTRRLTRLGIYLLTTFCTFFAALPARGQALEWKTNFALPGATNADGVADHLLDGTGVFAVAATPTAVFYGGNFRHFGSTPVMNIARVDKANGSVSALGSGLNGQVTSMVAIGSDLYVSGEFYGAGGVAVAGIAKWDGATWSAVGSGLGGPVLSLVVMGGDLYAGGYFDTAGGVTVNGVAKWNGTAWSAVGGGVTGYVYALHVAGSDLYVGGEFTAAGAVPAANIAKWNGSSWSALGTGSDEPVTAIGVAAGSVFAGKEGGGGLSRWDGTAWSIFDDELLYNAVKVITPVGNSIFVGGAFTGSLAAYRLESGDWFKDIDFTVSTQSFPRLGGAEEYEEYPVYAIVHDAGALYVGGQFVRVTSQDENHELVEFSAVNAAKIVINGDGSVFFGGERSPVVAGDGLANFSPHQGGQIRGNAILDTGDDVFVGGGFHAAGTAGRPLVGPLTSAIIVRWNKATRTWHSPMELTSLTGDHISALAKVGSTIYAASISGEIYRYVNDVFGEYWEYFAAVNGEVRTLAAHSGKLIVGGRFTALTSPESVTASSLLSFDGTTWAPLGSGIAPGVGPFAGFQGAYSMAVNGGDLYVGGDFTSVGGVAAVDVAKWNGTTWSAVGGGISTEQFSTVNALAFGSGRLYAGGNFTSASGTPASKIAQWDGSAWSALGSGVTLGYGDVHGIAISGTSLYAVGSFFGLGGSTQGIAKWDGAQWSSLGTGLSRIDYDGAVTADGTSLFVTGGFTKAGGKPSHGFAEYGPAATIATLIDDKFDDGNLATNTHGTGNGFLNGSQQPVTESGGFANFNNGGVSTEVIASNPLDAANPFQPSPTILTFTYGDISHTSTSVLQRLWIGYRRTGPVGFVYFPGAIYSSFGSGRQGLYVSVLSQNVGEDGYTRHGNLVATNDSGVRTTLASWTWANPAQLSGLVVKLTTTATHYQLEFSGAAGGVPTYTFGSGTGLISGMGSVLTSTKFDIGGMNQYFGGSGGQARLDSVLLQRSLIAPATVAFANATPSANPVNALAAPNLVTVALTRTGNTAQAISAQVVPGQPATTPAGFAKYVYGTDYEFVTGTAAGSTVAFAAGQTTATVGVQLKSPVLTKKGQFRLTLTSLSGANFIGSPAAATVTINARDTVAPTIVLNTPVAGATFDVTGTAKDAGGLSAFTVKVNGVTLPLTVDPLTGYVANTNAPYSSLGAIAENGPNIVTVTATDGSGNTSVATKTVTYLNNRPTLAGTYTALLIPSGTPDGDLVGFVTVTVTATGVTTGKLTISGATVSLAGLVNNAGAVMFKPTNRTALDLVDDSEFDAYLGALSLNVSLSGLTGSLTTQATGGTTLATLSGVKTPYTSTNLVPAGLLTSTTKGVYTVVFPSKAQTPPLTASAYPQGDGFATLTLTNAGVVSVVGKLADGTALTASSNLRADGKVAFFVSLYKKLGLLAGDLTFAALANSDISGSNLLWVRPAQKTGLYYRTGWENGIRIDAIGAKYIAPAALNFGQGSVDAVNGNAALVFTDGQLASTITHSVNVNPATGAVTLIPAAGAPYKLTLTTATGLFTGSFTHSGGTNTFNGVLINKGANNAGFGYFLSIVPLTYGASGESGGVTLQP